MNWKTRTQFQLVTAAAILMLGAALLNHHLALLKSENLAESAAIKTATESATFAHSGLGPESQDSRENTAGLPEGSGSEDDRTRARGTGYVWGTALRELFAAATIAPDGTKELDVSNLKRAYRGFRRPIELADPSVSPTLRAEYLAATITAGLNMPTAEQGPIAQLLERYFAADYALRDLDAAALADERSNLSREARSELDALLPINAQAEFRKLFASPTFLFVTMCVTADRILLREGVGTTTASGNATLTIRDDNHFNISAHGGILTQISADAVTQPKP
jgi:hypothetical protein